MSRISRIGRLQRGHVPRLSHISLEQTLQKVCPHGIKAEPLLLSMQTQHSQSLCPAPPFSSLLLLLLQSTPSVSSISVISDFTWPEVAVGPSLPALELRSAANAIARFMPGTAAGPTTDTVSVARCSSSRVSIMVKVDDDGLHVAPQHPIPFNPSRCLMLVHLPIRSAPSILFAALWQSWPPNFCN